MADTTILEWSKFAGTLVVAVTTITIGFIQYGTTSSFEVRKPFLQKQTDLCLAAADSAARLATSVDPAKWKTAREDFFALYWGPLAVVEDVESTAPHPVESAMVAYRSQLLTHPAEPAALPLDDLTQPSLKIAHACQAILSERWQAGILGWFTHRRGTA